MKRLAIFAGYNEENIIEDYVIYYIKELKKIADIIYVSNCYFDNNELNKISEYCLEMICKPHGEYDFGSYKKGYIYAKEKDILRDYDYLLFCNDSVFGPFFDLKTIVENMENKDLDAWSMFHCFEDYANLEHLQSYFLSMNKKVFLDENVAYFIMSIMKLNTKENMIVNNEIGFTNFLKKYKYNIGGYFNSSYIRTNDNNNLPFYKSEELIEKVVPFFKRSILISDSS